MTAQKPLSIYPLLILIILAVLAIIFLDHTQLDLSISNLFFQNGDWVLNKKEQPYRHIFYKWPKFFLQFAGFYLMWVILYRQRYRATHPLASYSTITSLIPNTKTGKNWLLRPLTDAEISYLIVTFICIPLFIGSLKDMTHVACPNHLTIYGGEYPYLSVWEYIKAKIPSKCFPAGHASTGFALYAFAYLPRWYRNRYKFIALATALGWILGAYKIIIGDHFFSHTVVSMFLGWAIAYGISMLFFPKRHYEFINRTNYQEKTTNLHS